jgi:hypothetical protein
MPGLEGKHVVLTLYWVSVRDFLMQLIESCTGKFHSPNMLDNGQFIVPFYTPLFYFVV